MKIAKGTLKSHHMCVIRDSKYVTKDVKCYSSVSLMVVASSQMEQSKCCVTEGACPGSRVVLLNIHRYASVCIIRRMQSGLPSSSNFFVLCWPYQHHNFERRHSLAFPHTYVFHGKGGVEKWIFSGSVPIGIFVVWEMVGLQWPSWEFSWQGQGWCRGHAICSHVDLHYLWWYYHRCTSHRAMMIFCCAVVMCVLAR